MIWKSLGVNDRRIQNGIVPPAIIRPVMCISEPLVAPHVRKLLRSELKFRIYLEELTGRTARPKCGFRSSELSRTMTDSLTTFARGVTESGEAFGVYQPARSVSNRKLISSAPENANRSSASGSSVTPRPGLLGGVMKPFSTDNGSGKSSARSGL
jgi:hypothetical protein